MDIQELIESLGDDTVYDVRAIVELSIRRNGTTRDQQAQINRLRVYLHRLKKKGHLSGSALGAHWKKAKNQPLKIKRAGRPLKYRALIEGLADLTVYTPAMIVAIGIEQGLVEDQPKVRKRVRNALREFALSRRFPEKGDGLAGYMRAWLGSRWKKAIAKI